MADVVPPNVDYRKLLRLKERKEQSLGTCWACATVAMLEVRLKLDNYWNDLPSIQHLINCCKCNGGTNGGNCSGALDFILRHGLATEDDCPERRDGAVRRACRNCNSNILSRIRITGHRKVQHITELNLQRALDDYGAICVGVTVGPMFDRYTGGITRDGFHNPNEVGPGISKHYLTLIGYNEDENGPYWTLLNSHSPEWGEDGCIRLHRDQFFRFQTARYITGAYVIPSV